MTEKGVTGNEKEGEIWVDELANQWIFRNGKWKPMVYIKEADEWEEE